MKKIIALLVTALVVLALDRYVISAMEGRSANPSYIRTPRMPYGIDRSTILANQQRGSSSSMPTQSHMMVRPQLQEKGTEVQNGANDKHYQQTHAGSRSHMLSAERLIDDRQEEIANYTHMTGTSDNYDNYDMIR